MALLAINSSSVAYLAMSYNRGLDRDKDGVACESCRAVALEPTLASYRRIEERELEAGRLS